MLRELRLRNFAVVESVTVAFAAGLNVLTGETGAGKSILVDAIVLVRGGRAQTDGIRADPEEGAARVGALHAKYRAAVEEAERTRAAARDRAQREDLLRFQVSELDAARLRVGEDDELRGELRRLQHAERFTTGLAEAAALLDEAPQSASERLARALKLVQDPGRLDPMFAAP